MSRPEHVTREARFLSLISGQTRGAAASITRAMLRGAAVIYAGMTGGRNALFDREWKTSQSLGRPTISVGNLTTGGTGKTPVVVWLAIALRQRGETPAVLTRGYGARDGMSDEAELITSAVNDLPVTINPDRVAGAADTLARRPDVSCFLLDDGFQHRRAKRDVDLVLIDATNPFGHGFVLPRGLLREPRAGLRRATAVLLTRVDQAKDLAATQREIRRLAPDVPVFRSSHRLLRLIDAHGVPARPGPIDRLALFAGLGNPAAFFHQAAAFAPGGTVKRVFPDHHPYTAADVAKLFEWAGAMRAEALVTTEKDWVKLVRIEGVNDGPVPVWRAPLAVDFQDGHGDALLELIAAKLATARST